MIESQKKVDKYMEQFEEGYWEPMALLAALIEEVGEVAREMNHMAGVKPKRDKDIKDEAELEEEIGDLFFALVCIANKYNIDLGKAIDKTIAKYNERDKDRWKRKNGQSPW